MIIKPKGDTLHALNSLKDMERLTKLGVRSAWRLSGQSLVRESRRSIVDDPKTGRVYLIRRRRHRASAPGESPANLTGRLRKSIGFVLSGKMDLEFGVGPSMSTNVPDYARTLELGGGRIAKRPYLIKAIEKEDRNMENYLFNEIRKSIRGEFRSTHN